MGGGLAQREDENNLHISKHGGPSGSQKIRQYGSISERLPGFVPPNEISDEEDDCGSPNTEKRNQAAKYGDNNHLYNSKNFRDNPLLSNKGRSNGFIDFNIPDRAATISYMAAHTKRINDKIASV